MSKDPQTTPENAFRASKHRCSQGRTGGFWKIRDSWATMATIQISKREHHRKIYGYVLDLPPTQQGMTGRFWNTREYDATAVWSETGHLENIPWLCSFL